MSNPDLISIIRVLMDAEDPNYHAAVHALDCQLNQNPINVLVQSLTLLQANDFADDLKFHLITFVNRAVLKNQYTKLSAPGFLFSHLPDQSLLKVVDILFPYLNSPNDQIYRQSVSCLSNVVLSRIELFFHQPNFVSRLFSILQHNGVPVKLKSAVLKIFTSVMDEYCYNNLCDTLMAILSDLLTSENVPDQLISDGIGLAKTLANEETVSYLFPHVTKYYNSPFKFAVIDFLSEIAIRVPEAFSEDIINATAADLTSESCDTNVSNVLINFWSILIQTRPDFIPILLPALLSVMQKADLSIEDDVESNDPASSAFETIVSCATEQPDMCSQFFGPILSSYVPGVDPWSDLIAVCLLFASFFCPAFKDTLPQFAQQLLTFFSHPAPRIRASALQAAQYYFAADNNCYGLPVLPAIITVIDNDNDSNSTLAAELLTVITFDENFTDFATLFEYVKHVARTKPSRVVRGVLRTLYFVKREACPQEIVNAVWEYVLSIFIAFISQPNTDDVAYESISILIAAYPRAKAMITNPPEFVMHLIKSSETLNDVSPLILAALTLADLQSNIELVVSVYCHLQVFMTPDFGERNNHLLLENIGIFFRILPDEKRVEFMGFVFKQLDDNAKPALVNALITALVTIYPIYPTVICAFNPQILSSISLIFHSIDDLSDYNQLFPAFHLLDCIIADAQDATNLCLLLIKFFRNVMTANALEACQSEVLKTLNTFETKFPGVLQASTQFSTSLVEIYAFCSQPENTEQ